MGNSHVHVTKYLAIFYTSTVFYNTQIPLTHCMQEAILVVQHKQCIFTATLIQVNITYSTSQKQDWYFISKIQLGLRTLWSTQELSWKPCSQLATL